MGTIASPWRHDAAREPAIFYPVIGNRVHAPRRRVQALSFRFKVLQPDARW